MKSFNWGNGITLAITIFIIAVLSMVSYLISLDFYLVNDNHYVEGSRYQETIDSRKRTSELDESVMVFFDEERIAVKIIFPPSILEKVEEGSLHLYRPNNSDLDMKIPIEFSEGGTHIIPMNEMEKGKWILTILWTMNGLEYIEEKSIIR